ncbi:MAG: hypothetical protein QM756_12460 [Polyangiaceae bacterium]
MTVALPDAEPRRGRSFRVVSLVFVVLLGIGLAMGFVVYKKYVAYEPRVAAHVPATASAALRVDLTHVMFYEPFRRSIFPLADRFAQGGHSRRERLEEQGIRVNSDVRELAVLFGPAQADWALLVGGRLPRGSSASGLAAVLRSEGRAVDQEGDLFQLPPSGLAFAEASDGVLVLASSREALRLALPVGTPDPVLASGAGGVVIRGGWLPSPLDSLTASFRAGSVVEVSGQAQSSSDASAGEAVLKALFQQLVGNDAPARDAVQRAALSHDSNGIQFRLGLSREAMLGLIEFVGSRAPG